MEKRNILRLSNEESNRITRECIQTAFIHLLSNQDMDKITVSEIVKKAGVSRNAFYRNYATKEDILTSFANERLEEINLLGWRAITEGNPHILYGTVFSQIKNESEQFSLLMKAGFLDRELLDIRDFLLAHYGEHNAKVRYMLFGWSGMIKNIILDWYLGGMKEDIESMSELCCSLSDSIVKQITAIDPSFAEAVTDIVE